MSASYSCPKCQASRGKETRDVVKPKSGQPGSITSRFYYGCGTVLLIRFDGLGVLTDWSFKCNPES